MLLEERLYNSTQRRCQHVKPSGNQCNLAAMRERDFCHFHRQVQRQRAHRHSMLSDMVHVEDTASLKLAFNDIIGRMLRGHINVHEAAIVIRSLRSVLAVMRLESTALPPDPDVVTDYRQLEPNVNWRKHMNDAQAKQVEEQEDPANSEGVRSIAEVLLPITERLFARRPSEPVPDDDDTTARNDEAGNATDDSPSAEGLELEAQR